LPLWVPGEVVVEQEQDAVVIHDFAHDVYVMGTNLVKLSEGLL
jgi:hypothetical protein